MGDFIQVPRFGGRFGGGRGGRGRGRRGRGRGRGRGGRWGRGHGGRNFSDSGDLSNDLIDEIGEPSTNSVTIAVEGCCHGELDRIYNRLVEHEKNTGQKIDLLLCCGDFQSHRNAADFHSSSIPPKYQALGTFPKYYSGEKRAPILTIFIGGNHEASQPLRELYLGGWMAPNIYYLGAAGVVRFGGLRIGGISGIYKSHDYKMGQYEHPPFDRSSLRSVYHVRNVDVYRLKCLENSRERIDIMLSHDWPLGIEQHGKTEELLRKKPYFRNEVERNDLGSPPNREIMDAVKPKRWFSAHLHVKFEATLVHAATKSQTNDTGASLQLIPSQISIKEHASVDTENEETQDTKFHGLEASTKCDGPDLTDQMTRFLALDKCLPRRKYLSILHMQSTVVKGEARLEYDPEWLAIVKKTHNLTCIDKRPVTVPTETISVSDTEIHLITEELQKQQKCQDGLAIPQNFCRTVPIYTDPMFRGNCPPLPLMGNPQTDALLRTLQLDHSLTVPFDKVISSSGVNSQGVSSSMKRVTVADDNEIELDELSEAGDEGEVLNPAASTKDIADDNEIDLSSVESDGINTEVNVENALPALKKPRHGEDQ